MGKVSVAGAARSAKAAEKKVVKDRAKTAKTGAKDSFQNFATQTGIGTNNVSSAANYGFNPITRDRTMLEWMHRGNFIAGLAVDIIADDMTRAGVEFKGELKPAEAEKLEEAATRLNVWGKVNSAVKWGRLYGGGLGINLVKGQNYSTPWDPTAIGKDQYKGLLVVDRWMVEPSLNDLVTEEGPHLGQPKFYTIGSNAPALRLQKVHYSRVIRMEGTDIPYQQRLMENLWTTSVYERIYDRMVAFDSATLGAAQLVYKAYLRVIKIPGLRGIIAEGGSSMNGVAKFVEWMRMFQVSEGITLLDGEDEYTEHGATAFSGLAEALIHFGQQISGALGIPLVRLFGQSPAGLNSTGDSDMRLYYDTIFQQQMLHLLQPMTNVYRAIALSEGITLPKGWGIKFRPLWQLDEIEKSEVAAKDAQTVVSLMEAGVYTPPIALREMKQSSQVTGRGTNIRDEDIAEAEALMLAPTPEKVAVAEVNHGDPIEPDPAANPAVAGGAKK